MKPERVSAISRGLGHSFLLFALIAAVIALGDAAAAQSADTQPVDDQAIDSSTNAPASLSERMSLDGTGGAEPKPDPDPAFGAFQRGYYLTAFQLALPRAQLGDPAAQTLIAELYDNGLGVARDRKEAAQWYQIAANNGDREAQFGYAVKLLEGRYVERDVDEAKRLMKIAADGGHASAAFNYAQLLIDERPTTTGVQEAIPYLDAAAEAGLADALFVLAQIYDTGKANGFPENEKAFDHMLRAAKAGIDTAQVQLGIWLANGYAGIQDEVNAFRWMERAATGGNVIARNRLAKMYANGVGTRVDPVEAAKWHILAQRAGLNDAWLDDYLKAIDREQLAKGLEAANRWPSS